VLNIFNRKFPQSEVAVLKLELILTIKEALLQHRAAIYGNALKFLTALFF